MSFVQLDYPNYDLRVELERLLQSGTVSWAGNQMCINSVDNKPDNFNLGTGSLEWDWDNQYKDSNGVLQTPKRAVVYKESDFTTLSPQFANTAFADVFDLLTSTYSCGRIRIMRSIPKTCLSWHMDSTPRVHYVIKTQPGCAMVIENTSKYLPTQTWWWTDTTKKHTAFNGSYEDRIHLVATILEEDNE